MSSMRTGDAMAWSAMLGAITFMKGGVVGLAGGDSERVVASEVLPGLASNSRSAVTSPGVTRVKTSAARVAPASSPIRASAAAASGRKAFGGMAFIVSSCGDRPG